MAKVSIASKIKQAVSRQNKNTSTTKAVSSKLKKQLLKSKNLCRVTFRYSREIALAVSSVSLVGDFNNWDDQANAMKKTRSGNLNNGDIFC